MNEEFLYYIWRNRKFTQSDLRLVSGEKVTILHTGFRNQHSGPDFSFARIRINDQIWVGNIEIHVKSSDWKRHGHMDDPAYSTIVLHVVYENDQEIHQPSRGLIPTLELKSRIDEKTLRSFENMNSNSHPVFLCNGLAKNIDPFLIRSQLRKAFVQRLERKIRELETEWELVAGDWDELVYRRIASWMGMPVNSLPMLWLSRSVSWRFLTKRKDIREKEIVLLGMSGLKKPKGWTEAERKDFSRMVWMWGLDPLDPSIWKFGRMRPHSFPQAKIRKLARWVQDHDQPFGWIRDKDVLTTKEELSKEGWTSAEITSFLANVYIPVMAMYHRIKNQPADLSDLMEQAERLEPEQNSKVEMWIRQFEDKSISLLNTQGILEQLDYWCTLKKCVNCSVGSKILAENDPKNC